MTSILRRVSAILFAAIFTLSIPLAAYAVEANVSYGDVSVGDTQVTHTPEAGGSAITEDHGGSVTVTGSSDTNTVTVTAGSTEAPANVHVEIQTTEGGNTNVVLDDANIESPRGAMEVTGSGDVVIELDGTNSLTSTDNGKAGLQVGPDSSITIQDANNDGGSLTAQGATWGAGIGGNANDASGDITITGGTVVATGGEEAAGIGGGQGTTNGNITITGGNVTAQGAYGSAGIGSGFVGVLGDGNVGDIAISGGTVTASGGTGAAGIGGGTSGLVGDITITGGNIIATGGADYFETGGAGIGSGVDGIMGELVINETEGTVTVSSNNITISGGDITATGGGKAADIGHGTGYHQHNADDPVGIVIEGDAVINTTDEDDIVIGAVEGSSAVVTVDTSKLTAGGSVGGVAGTYVPPVPEPDSPADPVDPPAEPSAPSTDPVKPSVNIDYYYYAPVSAELYTVSEDYTKTEKDGVLTITVMGEEAKLEITASGIRELIADGIHTLVFVTDNAETQVVLDELVKDCADTDEFVISHKGYVTTIILNGEEVK